MNMWSEERIKKEVERLNNVQPFWHSIRLPYGLFTTGRKGETRLNYNEVKWERIKKYIEPRQKRVVDVGCNEGFFSIEMIKAGAKEVYAIDINKHRIEKARFVLDVLSISGIKLKQIDIYDVPDLDIGTFDIALALGILHRVPDPYTLIKILTGIADVIVFEWSNLLSSEPIMQFWGGGYKMYDIDNSGYWKPTVACVKAILERQDFCFNYCIDQSSDRAILISCKQKNEEIENNCARDDQNLSLKKILAVFKKIIGRKTDESIS